MMPYLADACCERAGGCMHESAVPRASQPARGGGFAVSRGIDGHPLRFQLFFVLVDVGQSWLAVWSLPSPCLDIGVRGPQHGRRSNVTRC